MLAITNRVALNKPISLQSVNGPWVTIIQGAGMTNGVSAVRCAWLTNGASLTGFTLRYGATGNASDVYGGGVASFSNTIVANCLIYSNTAAYEGGGAYQGTLRNCAIYGNNCPNGGGTCNSILNNCTVAYNSGTYTAGVYFGRFTNCIVYYNSTIPSGNYANATFSYCCTLPMPSGPSGGVGNFTNAPQLFVDNIHLLTNSPCIGAGTNLVTGTDIDGNPWANPPSIGCSEWQPIPFVGKPQIQLTNSPIGFNAIAAATGAGTLNCWWLKDGVPLQDNGHFNCTQTTNLIATGVSYSDAGNYQLVVSNAFGVVTSAVAQLVVHCVDVAGTNPIAPYSTWATAATNIQDAITASVTGDIVLVTNGLYAVGGKSMDGVITNRISVDKAILVQSVNGQAACIIQGFWNPIVTNGPLAVRCVWMTNGAMLNGFTIRGGATRLETASPNQSMNGGGIWGISTNAMVYNCIIATNLASYDGGGAYQVTLNNCTLIGNRAIGTGVPGGVIGYDGTGGGADYCNLKKCMVIGNFGNQDGGGAANCNLINCAITQNSAVIYGGGVYNSMLINCTISMNTVGNVSYGLGGGAAGSSLTNSLVFANLNLNGYTAYSSNLYSSTLAYCCASPLPTGLGNISADPQLLADGIHLSATSPCIGAGINVATGTDIDGQSWNNPPSIGCDEWQPAPAISAQLVYQINPPAHGLTFNVIVAGQSPFTFFWSKDGSLIQDDTHHSNSSTANLVVNNFGPDDAGLYQVVVSNAFGVATSQVAQVVIHVVYAAGANPVAPYSTWATAATNIQDAINVASAADIVLVTNGVYATGGKVMAGDLTNRVALDKPVTVLSVNGYAATVIQGTWDTTATNGPGAVRCAYLAGGAILNGFTLQNGATRATGDSFSGGPLESGGGVWCVSTNGVVSNCLLTNNSAIYGGGISYGTLNNCLVTFNLAVYGGGAYSATLNNCTVVNNYTTTSSSYCGAGTYNGITGNSVVVGNFDNYLFGLNVDNYSDFFGLSFLAQYSYSCTSPTKSGTGNINVNPQFLDGFHIASTSPCRGAGSALYASGTDLDGEPWANPPSMGCDEVVVSNLVGPLSVNIQANQTNLLVNRHAGFWGIITGRAAYVSWSFGDGSTTNSGAGISHQWTNSGDYIVTLTAYNNDNPAGVSTNILFQVLPLNTPQLESAMLLTNGFQFQFAGQWSANYTIQYTTNLTPPVTWQTLQTIYYNTEGVIQINDSAWTNTARFYRVLAQ
jgi:hypothetical protein